MAQSEWRSWYQRIVVRGGDLRFQSSLSYRLTVGEQSLIFTPFPPEVPVGDGWDIVSTELDDSELGALIILATKSWSHGRMHGWIGKVTADSLSREAPCRSYLLYSGADIGQLRRRWLQQVAMEAQEGEDKLCLLGYGQDAFKAEDVDLYRTFKANWRNKASNLAESYFDTLLDAENKKEALEQFQWFFRNALEEEAARRRYLFDIPPFGDSGDFVIPKDIVKKVIEVVEEDYEVAPALFERVGEACRTMYNGAYDKLYAGLNETPIKDQPSILNNLNRLPDQGVAVEESKRAKAATEEYLHNLLHRVKQQPSNQMKINLLSWEYPPGSP